MQHADQIKKPTEILNIPAGNHTDGATVTDRASTDKQIATLKARYAMCGHVLHSTDPADGPVTFFSSRWGMVRHLPTVGDAEAFLAQITGGASHE